MKTRCTFGNVLRAALLPVCAFSAIISASGQLAITEVMSGATTNSVSGKQYPDFWELTNFGTNILALDNYRFSDDRGVSIIENSAFLFSGKQIGPSESIVFVRTVSEGVETPAHFRAWWGAANLPANLQIYFYSSPGFNNLSDAVQLFQVTATSTTQVDRVDLFQARDGFTFTYDPDSGVFGGFSVAGEHGAFGAVEGNDVGSPGFTTGPAPLFITSQPQSLTVDAGTPASFGVQHQGIPRPHLQWHRNGVPIPGAISNFLTISPAVPTNAGNYSVELDNRLMRIVSLNATLVVNTNPSCARIVVPPADLSAYTDQTAVFIASVRGYPLPAIQWQFNGTNIPGATNTTLYVANVTMSSAGDYSIRVTNLLCTNPSTVRLTVTLKPLLAVTEAMSQVSTNTTVSGHGDWWELTSFDTIAINLHGYRFNDYPGPSLEGTFDITNDVVIQPGESILFARQMSADAFKNWWGEENLPENIQIITYSSHNFDEGGDAIFLWNAAALDPADYITAVNFVNFTTGVTLWFDPLDPINGTYGEESVLGQHGALRALEADDIGSPGYITNHPPRSHSPRFISLMPAGPGVKLTWTARPGKRYELQYKSVLTTNVAWTALGQHSATGLSLAITDSTATNVPPRFYRLRVLPDTP